MGEGDSLADVTAGAPYRNWDSIIASGMGSPSPYYFEGLVLEIQGKIDEANRCYELALTNPIYGKRDFWYLRNMSVSELYEIRKNILAKEIEIYEEYTPKTILCTTTRIGAEFSPTYHLILASQAATDGEVRLAWNCALNALLTNPTTPELYYTAASYGLTAKDDMTFTIVNEGLVAFPEDGSLNFLAGAIEIAAGKNEEATDFLRKAQACEDKEIVSKSTELLTQMGLQ